MPSIDIRRANNPDDVIMMQGSSGGLTKSFTAQDVFDAIEWHEKNFLGHGFATFITFNKINSAINELHPGRFYSIGSMLGESICVDNLGKIRIGSVDDLEEQWRKDQEDILRDRKQRRDAANADKGCEHSGWVVRDIQGDNRYLCRECNARFPRHPRVLKPEPKLPHHVLDAMTEFRQGAQTFTNACEQAKMSAEELKKAIQNAFPPKMTQETIQHHTLGKPTGEEIVVREYPEPQRTSDPEEIESIFTTAGVSPEDLVKIWKSTFEDITDVDFGVDERKMCQTIKLNFVDGTTQLVKIDFKEMAKGAMGKLI